MFASGKAVKMVKRKIKWELRKGRKKEQGETTKENEDRPDGNLPKDVPVDQREAKFVEAEESGQERAEDRDEQVGEGINKFLIMKHKKDMPMPPPETPRPELEDPAGGNLDTDQLRPSLSMPTLPTFHSVSDAALAAKYRAERVKAPHQFDKETAEINKALTTAKIRRGGSNSLRLHGGNLQAERTQRRSRSGGMLRRA